MKILLTGGGTTEKIDSMRVITNKSTGRTALSLANTLSSEHDITLLLSSDVSKDFHKGDKYLFTSCEDLYGLLQHLQEQSYDLIIHAAAVGDYEVSHFETKSKVTSAKIPSGLSDLTLHLKPTRKIINEIKKLYPQCYLVGFKLTDDIPNDDILLAVDKVRGQSNADLIVHNKISDRQSGLDIFHVYGRSSNSTKISSLENLAECLIQKMREGNVI